MNPIDVLFRIWLYGFIGLYVQFAFEFYFK
jgi:hypothetical protein